MGYYNDRNNDRGRNNYDRDRHNRPQQRPSYGQPQRSQTSDAERSFLSKVSIDPSPRIRLEKGLPEFTMRAMDL